MGHKLTNSQAASNAAHVLGSRDASPLEKSVAGSTLAQSKAPKKVTSNRVASEAGHILQDANEPFECRSAAGSALAQREK